MPEISVLIPYYNDEDFLKESIQSVLNQTYKDFELILLNHACTDSSREIAHSFPDSRIVHIDLPTNAGAGGGIILDTFLNAAHGKYLKLFCADDILHENFLEKCISFFQNNPEKSIFFTNMNFINSDGKNEGHCWFQYRNFNINCESPEYEVLKNYFHGNSVLPLPACIFKRELAEKITIDFSLVMEFDVLLWTRLLVAGGKLGFSGDCFVDYRIHSRQTSSSAHKIKAFTQSIFEHEILLDEFMKIMNLTLLEVIIDNPIKFQLQKFCLSEHADFFAKFLYAKFLLGINNFLYQRCGYKYIHDLLQKAESRKLLEEKLGYSIYDFRKTYSEIKISNNEDFFSYFFSGGHKNLNNLGIKGLFIEILRRLKRKIVKNKSDKLIPL